MSNPWNFNTRILGPNPKESALTLEELDSSLLFLSYSLETAGPVTASYALTASYVQTAQTASYALTASYVQTAQTASYVLNAVSASYSATSSYAATSTNALSATSASYILATDIDGSTLGSYTDDTAAAIGGVPLYGLYRNGNVVLIRIV
jgi:hypothetical protein